MKRPPIWISEEEIETYGSLRATSEQMRCALATDVCSTTQVPRRSLIVEETPFAVFGAMPAYSREHDLFVTKCAAFVQDRKTEQCAGSVGAIVAAFSARTGDCIALLDGAALTNLKCAAITSVVSNDCARQDARTLAVIGTGVQARQQVRGVLDARRIAEIRVYSRERAHVERFIDETIIDLPASVYVVAARSVEDAIEGADIVSTATTSTVPLFSETALREHVHINCMGAHTPTSRELPEALLRSSLLIVEDRETAIAEAGDIHANAIEVRELASQNRARLQSQRTVFSSTGHALLDLLTVARVLRAMGIHGHDVEQQAVETPMAAEATVSRLHV